MINTWFYTKKRTHIHKSSTCITCFVLNKAFSTPHPHCVSLNAIFFSVFMARCMHHSVSLDPALKCLLKAESSIMIVLSRPRFFQYSELFKRLFFLTFKIAVGKTTWETTVSAVVCPFSLWAEELTTVWKSVVSPFSLDFGLPTLTRFSSLSSHSDCLCPLMPFMLLCFNAEKESERWKGEAKSKEWLEKENNNGSRVR